MGPNYDKGKTSIGRQRLPEGLVAILDDLQALYGAIEELHAYALGVHVAKRPRRGIVYRVVSESERQAISYKLQGVLGMKRFLLEGRTYAISTGQWHLMDDAAISHVHARHGAPDLEARLGHLAVTAADVCRVPEVVCSQNIVEFSVAKGKPRIVYERCYSDGALRVVEEIQPTGGLAFKTCYKKR